MAIRGTRVRSNALQIDFSNINVTVSWSTHGLISSTSSSISTVQLLGGKVNTFIHSTCSYSTTVDPCFSALRQLFPSSFGLVPTFHTRMPMCCQRMAFLAVSCELIPTLLFMPQLAKRVSILLSTKEEVIITQSTTLFPGRWEGRRLCGR